MLVPSIVTLVAGILVSAIGGYLFYSKVAAFNKASSVLAATKKDIIQGGIGLLTLGAGFLLLFLTPFLNFPEWASLEVHPEESVFAGQAINYGLYLSSALIGSFFFGISSAIVVGGLSILMKKEKMDPFQKKVLKTVFYCAIPVLVLSFILGSSGFGPYLTYPLINGIGFGGAGIYWLRVGERGDGLHITWYAMCYLLGVAVCYIICDHAMYKRYGKHGIIDTLVLVAFPAGIIGGRIWYVVGNWEREFAGRPWYSVFEIWNGGLTILGGAAAGIIVGYIFMRVRRKYVDPRWAVDVIVPTILLAQFVGRWGNFFNCEVYGVATDVGGWSFLPNWLLEQMHVSNSGSLLPAGEIYVPLFLIEGVINLVGYFVIAKGLPTLFKKKLVPGDLGAAYFVWYGLVRMIMEPLRDTNFNMGTDNAWSVVNSIAYILIGLAISLLLHLHDGYKAKGSFLPYAISAAAISFVALFMPLLPSINIVDGKEVVSYLGYEVVFSGNAPVFMAAFVLMAVSFVLFIVALIMVVLEKKGKLTKNFAFLSLGKGKGNADPLPLSSVVGYLAAPFALLSGILYFAGTTALGPLFLVGSEASANLSYGFSLAAILLIVSSLVSLSELLGRYDRNKAIRREGETSGATL